MRIVAEPYRGFSTSDLAAENSLSRNHLTKITAALAQAEIIISGHGAGGGAFQARLADQISLGEIVRILEY